MNKVFLCGNLTRDPELKRSQDGNAFARVGIAVPRPFSEEKAVDFFNLVAFNKAAEFMSKWFSKGSKILIEGRLQTSKYKDKKTGDDRTATDVIVENIEFADIKKDDGGKSNSGKSKASNTAADGHFAGEAVDADDMPF